MKPIRISRARIAFFHDVVMAALSFIAALYLRLGDNIAEYPPDSILLWTALFTTVCGGVFASMGLYRGIWRYASLDDILGIAKAVTLAILVFLPVMFLLTRLQDLPRSLLVINWFVLLALLGGPRILYRIFKDRSVEAVLVRDGHRRVPVLMVGAGDGTELFIRATRHRPGAGYRVVGIVDDKGTRIGRRIHGVPVMGGLEALTDIVQQLARNGTRPQRLVVTADGFDGARMRALLEAASVNGMALARLPRLTDLKSGTADDAEIRPVAIEDLLGRPQAALDREGMRALIAGRRVMVTGAGGTIGSELVRQIADFGPSHLTLLDNGEYNLYLIDQETGERAPLVPRAAVLCDVRDREATARAIAEAKPELVFHAAALKHVPLVETNAVEGVMTNAIGTRNVADACRAAGVSAMMLISTDKAVNPANVMGATKRVAESYCQALDLVDAQREGGTRFLTVRFGNVLGSTGSVVPLFQRQIAAGGPVTVTHPEITRYFMTTHEAVELVLQATALGVSARKDSGKIYVLDMGEPVKIADLARQMIRLSGLRPDQDIQVHFTGLRPGEKLYEELLHDSERPIPTDRNGILLAAPRAVDHAFLSRAMDELAEAASQGRAAQAVTILARLVPEGQLTAASPTPFAAAR